jgi:hypothetical protein
MTETLFRRKFYATYLKHSCQSLNAWPGIGADTN